MTQWQVKAEYYSGAIMTFGIEADGVGNAIELAKEITPNHHNAIVKVLPIPPRDIRKLRTRIP